MTRDANVCCGYDEPTHKDFPACLTSSSWPAPDNSWVQGLLWKKLFVLDRSLSLNLASPERERTVKESSCIESPIDICVSPTPINSPCGYCDLTDLTRQRSLLSLICTHHTTQTDRQTHTHVKLISALLSKTEIQWAAPKLHTKITVAALRLYPHTQCNRMIQSSITMMDEVA